MARASRQSPQPIASPCPPWLQANFPHHHSYHPGFPTMPPAQPYPPTSQHNGPGQFHYSPTLLQPQSSVQMLSQELVAAQRRLLQYTDLISNLYTELETIRNIICYNCKEKISLVNLGQHPPVFASHLPHRPSHTDNVGYEQTVPMFAPHMTPAPVAFPFSPRDAPYLQANLHTELTPNWPASSVPANLSLSPLIPVTQVPSSSEPTETSLPPPGLPPTNFVEEIQVVAQPITEKSRWSVVHNEIEKVLDVTFVHAFKHPFSANAVRFSPDGNFLAAGYNFGRTQVFDLKTMSINCALVEPSGYSNRKENPATWCVTFSPDGKHVVVGSLVPTIWDIATKRVVAAFKSHTWQIRSLDISPDGRLLVTALWDCSVRVWKMRDGSSKLLSTKGSPFSLARFSPNGRYIAASDLDGFLRTWDVRSGQLVGKWGGNGGGIIWSFAFSPDGQELVSASWGGEIKSWDLSSLGTPTRSDLSTEERVGEDEMLVQKDPKLFLDLRQAEVRAVSISPDGKWVITGSNNNQVRIWDIHTAVQQCALEGHISEPWAVDFSPVGNYIAIGSRDGFVTLWRYKICK